MFYGIIAEHSEREESRFNVFEADTPARAVEQLRAERGGRRWVVQGIVESESPIYNADIPPRVNEVVY